MSSTQWRLPPLMQACVEPARFGGNVGGWLIALLLIQMVWGGIGFALLLLTTCLTLSRSFEYSVYCSWFLPVAIMFWVPPERNAVVTIAILLSGLTNIVYIAAISNFLATWRQLL
jgi:hypothetical protein